MTGNIYQRAREYSPRLGRFLQRDPLGYPDGMNTYAAYHVMGQTTDWSGMGPTSVFESFGNWIDAQAQQAASELTNMGYDGSAKAVSAYGAANKSVGESLNIDRQLSQGLDETDRVAQRRINEGGECPARAYAEEGFKNLTPHGAAGHNLTEAAIGESRGVEDYGRELSGYERFERGVNGVAAGGAVFSAPGIASLARPKCLPSTTYNHAPSSRPSVPTEAYNRRKHYGNTPTPADRRAIGAGEGQVADHNPPLVKRYYEGDPATGEKPGHLMSDAERRASAQDRSRMQPQSCPDSNKQGGEMSNYSKQKKKEHGLE